MTSSERAFDVERASDGVERSEHWSERSEPLDVERQRVEQSNSDRAPRRAEAERADTLYRRRATTK